MLFNRFWQALLCVSVLLAGGVAWAANEGQDLLDQATDAKLAAENLADLTKVIKLCQEAIQTGLDDDNTKFANDLLASTLTQRAELVCIELFERPGPRARTADSDWRGAIWSNAEDRRRAAPGPVADRPLVCVARRNRKGRESARPRRLGCSTTIRRSRPKR